MKKITEASIKKHLGNDSFSFEIFDSIDSTNSYARKLLTESCNNHVIISDMQIAGRGRQGRSFYSPRNNGIYMSIILNVNKNFSEHDLFTIVVATIVLDAIEKVSGLECKIKWVNDIFVDRKKICGILCENVLSDDATFIEHIIVGIGINVASVEDFPKELSGVAGAMGLDIDRNLLISEILKEIYGFTASYEIEKYLPRYKEKSLVIDKKISFKRNETEYTGKVISINDKGHLIVDIGAEMIELKSGEIRLFIENVEE